MARAVCAGHMWLRAWCFWVHPLLRQHHMPSCQQLPTAAIPKLLWKHAICCTHAPGLTVLYADPTTAALGSMKHAPSGPDGLSG